MWLFSNGNFFPLYFPDCPQTHCAVWSRMTLNFWLSCLHLPSSGLTGMCYHAQSVSVILGIEPGALCLLGKHSYQLSHIPSPMGSFKTWLFSLIIEVQQAHWNTSRCEKVRLSWNSFPLLRSNYCEYFECPLVVPIFVCIKFEKHGENGRNW